MIGRIHDGVFKSEAFHEELKQLGMTLSEFKRTAMYQRAVEEGKVVDDQWIENDSAP